jgi:acetyl-CoA C-acetyltransferase
MNTDPVVIVAARRTPIGAFQGALSDVSATELGAAAVASAVAASGVDPADVGRVLMGCVLPAGLGQAPARQAALGAGLPKGVPCATVNKMCGSGMEALVLGHDLIAAGSAAIVVAGGLESMTNAPYLMPKARKGYRMGHQEILDHMFYDGLAVRAADDGSFDAEITPVTVKTRKGEHTVSVDEVPGTVSVEKIPNLRPAFAKDGTVTAASSSSISDGAAAIVIMRASEAEKRGLEPLARIVGHSAFAHEPAWFTTAPVHALQSLQANLGWDPDNVDIYEINEAFACVTMAAMKDVGIDHAKVNVNGGACALGHPIGATGARITTTLLHAMRARNLKRGIATQCIGGGEATAVALEID